MDNSQRLKNLIDSYNEEKVNIRTSSELNDLRIKYLGKKSELQDIIQRFGALLNEEKKALGRVLNETKSYIEKDIEILKNNIEELELNEKLKRDKIDVTLPGTNLSSGCAHPINRVREEIEDIFISMGYDVIEGPDVEEDQYNFELLNIPKGHPARDMQDSFYITDEILLRTHTSPVQARTMLSNKDKTPIRIICPGSTFRKDTDDATHSHQFHQIEGLLIDENISMSDLKGTLGLLTKKLFGQERDMRFRSSFFPFTEPSIEVDISCFKCDGKGCATCKDTGWIEILGAGMVHPNVLNMCGYDSKKYTGFAFGIGIERVAMLKYGITDIRMFYSNDLRFLKQFDRIEGDNNESK